MTAIGAKASSGQATTRVRRLRAEGMSVQQAEHEAVAAAVAVLMVANAIRVNTDWFWDGPNA